MRYRYILLIIALASLFFIGKGMTGFTVSGPCCVDCAVPCRAISDLAAVFAGIIVFGISLALYIFLKQTGEKV